MLSWFWFPSLFCLFICLFTFAVAVFQNNWHFGFGIFEGFLHFFWFSFKRRSLWWFDIESKKKKQSVSSWLKNWQRFIWFRMFQRRMRWMGRILFRFDESKWRWNQMKSSEERKNVTLTEGFCQDLWDFARIFGFLFGSFRILQGFFGLWHEISAFL